MYPAGEPEKNGAGHQGSQNGRVQGAPNAAPLARYESDDDAALSANDPRTRLLMEQLNLLINDNRRQGEEKTPQRHFDLATAWAMFRRRWPIMLGVFVLITAVVAWKLRPGAISYVATATMLLPQQDKMPKLDEVMQIRPSNTSSNVQTQTAIITSAPLVEKAWKRVPDTLRMQGWPLNHVPLQAVRAAAPVSPDLVDVTVTALHPEAAKVMANNLVTVYRQQISEWANESYVQSMASANRQVSQAGELYLKAKRELQEFQQKTGVTELGARLQSVNERIQQLQVEAENAQLEAASGLSSEKVLGDALLAELQKKADDARQNYEVVAGRYQPNSPEVQLALQTRDSAQKLLDSRQSALLSQQNQKASQLREQLIRARSESAALPPIASKFNELSTNVELLESTYKSLVDRATGLKLSGGTEVSTAKMVAPATKAIPTGRTWSRVILMAVLCGLILSVLAGILAEQIDNTVHSADELEGLIGSPVLGNLPMFNDDAERRLAFAIPSKQTGANGTVSTELARPQTATETARFSAARPLLEACRILRSNVNFSMMDAPLRSVLVTSADPGEGKSMCALNLATVMAYDGKRVILLDCDLRRPTQHRLCSSATNKVPMRPGFVDVLAGSVSIEEALRPTPVENLRVMPSGTLPPNPPELLSSHAGQNLLEQLRNECDLLVIDSPPLMFLTDSQVLASFVDGAILVVAASQTARGHVQRAHNVLRNAGGRVLGVIFNKVKAHNDPDAYYGSYYSYYAPTTEDGGDWTPDSENKGKRRRNRSEEREEAAVD